MFLTKPDVLQDYSLTASDADNDMKQSMVYATTPTTKSIDITSYGRLTSVCLCYRITP